MLAVEEVIARLLEDHSCPKCGAPANIMCLSGNDAFYDAFFPFELNDGKEPMSDPSPPEGEVTFRCTQSGKTFCLAFDRGGWNL